MGNAAERWFAVAAAAALLVGLAAVVAAPTGAQGDEGLAFDPGVPQELAFDPPDDGTAGVATVDGRRFDSLGAAVEAAEPGDTVRLEGRFDERVVVETPNLIIESAPGELAVIDGGGEGDVLTIRGDDVTVRRVWVRNSGFDAAENDAGIWVEASGVRIVDARVTAITFGVWLDGVTDARVANTTIVGRESVTPVSYRGNGIQIWKTEDAVVADNRITDVRDGIYYSWASGVLARGNTMWDLRYGVHYMYSDDCTLRDNLSFDNDVGYALMVSQRLHIVNNTALGNTGGSGHGVLVKSIDHTEIKGNRLVANTNGLYVFNSLDNVIAGNLVLDNDVGVHLTAGSVREAVYDNSFIRNGEPVRAVIGEQVAWNASDRGNYWSGARAADVNGDGISEIRYRPAGLVERLSVERPGARVYAESPAFTAVRLAESSIPVIESPGVIDYRPLVEPPHPNWRRYYVEPRD